MMLTENIKKLRKEKGMTQRELADALGISDKTVSRWESGVQVPDAMILPDLSKLFGVSISVLYGETETRHPESEEALCFENADLVHEKPNLSRRGVTLYKIFTVTALTAAVLISMLLCHLDLLRSGADEQNQRIRIILSVGLGAVSFLLLIGMFGFSLYCRRKGNPAELLQVDIRCSSVGMTILYALFALILPLMTAVEFSLWYMVGVYTAAVVFLFVMLHGKRRLRAADVRVGKVVSTVSVVLTAVTVSAVVIYCLILSASFRGQQVSVARQETYPMSYGGETITANVTTSSSYLQNTDRFLHIMYLLFLLSSLPMTAALLMNMTELLLLVSKHKTK